HAGEEQEPQQERVLGVVRLVHRRVELAEVFSGQDAGQLAALLGRTKLTFLPNLLGHISPTVVVQPGPSHDAGDLGDDGGLRLFVLRCETAGVFTHCRYSWWAKGPLEFRGRSLLRNT